MPPNETSARALPGWLAGPVLGAAGLSIASGFAQFAVTAVVGDVAADFGAPGAGTDPASMIGITGTTLGVALAVIRLASLGALPGTALADRRGRRPVALAAVTIGLLFTLASSLAQSFWMWVVLIALARPWLSTVNGVAGVLGAEETSAKDRSAAIAVVGGAYGLGAGAVAVLRGFLPDGSWRPAIIASVVALVAVPLLARATREPALYERAPDAVGRLGSIPVEQRRLLVLVALVTGGMAIATGFGFTYVFVYGERVLGIDPAGMSGIILLAGPTGLAGLALGRVGAERWGRRPTVAAAMLGTVATVALAYSGSQAGLVAGYLLGITTSAAFGPPMGALVAELFPTTTRSTATGWASAAGVLGAVAGLAAFGILVDAVGFQAGAQLLAIPVVASTGLLLAIPETRGQELAVS